jgi:hypothetical protein
MKLKTSELTTDRKWRSVTGYPEDKFRKLEKLFRESYLQHFGKSMPERHAGLEVKPAFDSEEELLLFTLLSLKSNMSYDMLGVLTGMDGSNAKRNQHLGIELLKRCLNASGDAPKREFASVEEFSAYFAQESALILDATEQRVERPGEYEEQALHYSGKKKPYA